MENALGDFLRARRELVTPAEVGLPAGGGTRRVPGLRREEVASLAGISIEYYLRLERGRDRTPSAQVVDALAEALLLDEESRDYLLTLAGRREQHGPGAQDRVPDGLDLLLSSINVPSVVFNKYCDILAANALGRALMPHMVPGLNLLRSMFIDPAGRELYGDWERSTADAVAHLRAVGGADTDDVRLRSLVGELSVTSERFRRLWARHDVRAARSGTFTFRHARLGDLRLRTEKLALAGSEGLGILMWHADPGTREAEAMAQLRVSAALPPGTRGGTGLGGDGGWRRAGAS
jgi:transcriptional regulator with XRE-family HTH domain